MKLAHRTKVVNPKYEIIEKLGESRGARPLWRGFGGVPQLNLSPKSGGQQGVEKGKLESKYFKLTCLGTCSKIPRIEQR